MNRSSCVPEPGFYGMLAAGAKPRAFQATPEPTIGAALPCAGFDGASNRRPSPAVHTPPATNSAPEQPQNSRALPHMIELAATPPSGRSRRVVQEARPQAGPQPPGRRELQAQSRTGAGEQAVSAPALETSDLSLGSKSDFSPVLNAVPRSALAAPDGYQSPTRKVATQKHQGRRVKPGSGYKLAPADLRENLQLRARPPRRNSLFSVAAPFRMTGRRVPPRPNIVLSIFLVTHCPWSWGTVHVAVTLAVFPARSLAVAVKV